MEQEKKRRNRTTLEKLHTNKLNNLDPNGQIPRNTQPTKTKSWNIENLSDWNSNQKVPHKESPGPQASLMNSIKHSNKNEHQFFSHSSQKID